MVKQPQAFSFRASALVITLMFIVLLGLEALVVGLLFSRSMVQKRGILRGKDQSMRRASEIVLNSLSQVIYNDLAIIIMLLLRMVVLSALIKC